MNRFSKVYVLLLSSALAATGCFAQTGSGEETDQSDSDMRGSELVGADQGAKAPNGWVRAGQNDWSNPMAERMGPEPDPWVGADQANPNGPEPDPWHAHARQLAPTSSSGQGTNSGSSKP